MPQGQIPVDSGYRRYTISHQLAPSRRRRREERWEGGGYERESVDQRRTERTTDKGCIIQQ